MESLLKLNLQGEIDPSTKIITYNHLRRKRNDILTPNDLINYAINRDSLMLSSNNLNYKVIRNETITPYIKVH